ncbi:MAG: DUF2141 domain-containing protein [Sulfurimonas sp.]|nr:DUF2141 domain-containing protein [Sulfurimonas sp.]
MEKVFLTSVILSKVLFCGEVNLEINNITSNCKTLRTGLYNTKESFSNVDKAYRGINLKVETSKINHTFSNIPNGTYAIALFCDENQNGFLDKNFIGIPKEAYGFSNNPKVFGKPNFEDTKFELNNNINLKIKVQK